MANCRLSFIMCIFVIGMIALLVLASGCLNNNFQSADEIKAKCSDYLAGKGSRDIQMDALCDKYTATATSGSGEAKGALNEKENNDASKGSSAPVNAFDAGIVYKVIASGGDFGDRPYEETDQAIKLYGKHAISEEIDSFAVGHNEKDVFIKMTLKPSKSLEDMKLSSNSKGALSMGFGLKGGGEKAFGFKCDTANSNCVAAILYADGTAPETGSDAVGIYVTGTYATGNTVHLQIKNIYPLIDPNGKLNIQGNIWTDIPIGEALDLK